MRCLVALSRSRPPNVSVSASISIHYSLEKVLVSVGAVLTTMRLCSAGHDLTEPTVDGMSLELLLLHLAGTSRPNQEGSGGNVSLLRASRAERLGDRASRQQKEDGVGSAVPGGNFGFPAGTEPGCRPLKPQQNKLQGLASRLLPSAGKVSR